MVQAGLQSHVDLLEIGVVQIQPSHTEMETNRKPIMDIQAQAPIFALYPHQPPFSDPKHTRRLCLTLTLRSEMD